MSSHRLVLVAAISAALVGLMLTPTGAGAAKTYRGFLSKESGASTHTAKAADRYFLSFRERRSGKVKYRVCMTGGDHNRRKCFNRTTGASGRSNIDVSLNFSDPDLGGLGKYKARWSVGGHTVARWDFKVTSQGVAEDVPKS